MTARDIPSRCYFNNAHCHSAHILRKFTALQDHRILCDIIINVDNEIFHLHKLMLFGASDYFNEMIMPGFGIEKKELDIPGVSVTSFKHIVKYIYSGKLSLDDQELLGVYTTSKILKMFELSRWCMLEMTQKVDIGNCLEFFNYAEKENHEVLFNSCKVVIAEHFGKVSQQLGFEKLTFKGLESVLETGCLKCDSELEVYKAIENWLKHNEQHKDRTNQLLEHVRFELISKFDNERLLKDDWMKDQNNADFVNRALQFQTGSDEEQVRQGGMLATPRHSLSLLVIGGKGAMNNDSDDIYVWDVDKETSEGTSKVSSLPGGRHGTTSVVFNNSVFVLGGCDVRGYKDSVFCLNTLRNTWTSMTPMMVKKGFATTFVIGEKIYICGGKADKLFKSVHKYTISTNKWEELSDLPFYLYYSASAIVDDTAYISGGARPTSVCTDIIFYNHLIDRWTRQGHMLQGRMVHTMVSYAGKLYNCGGCDGINLLQTTEVYNLATKQSTSLTLMPFRRGYTKGMLCNGKIYIAGGTGTSSKKIDKDARVDTVLVYEIDRDIWREGGGELPDGGVWQSSCVLVALP